MTRQLQLSSLLEQITTEVPDVRAAVVASRDGLTMASTIGGAEGSRIAAMAATVHAVGHRVTSTAELGDLEETVIRSTAMTFVVYDAGAPAVLALLADGDCNLGLLHLEGRRAAAALGELLRTPVGERLAPPPPPPAPPAPPAFREPMSEPTSMSEPSPAAEAETVTEVEQAPAHEYASVGDYASIDERDGADAPVDTDTPESPEGLDALEENDAADRHDSVDVHTQTEPSLNGDHDRHGEHEHAPA